MIDLLNVYNVGEKVRLGSANDGGYVLPKLCIKNSKYLFSYGISDDISFDEHYIEQTEFKNKVIAYDHTIDNIFTKYQDNFTLNKIGLSGIETNETSNFIKHYHDNNIKERVLLKVDVECCEYEWLENTNIETLSQIISGLIIEFHELSDEIYKNRFVEIIKKLNNYFYICHIHGNNWSHTFTYVHDSNTYEIPNVLEITFIPKNIVKNVQLDNSIYPCELDSPNNEVKREISLEFLNTLQKVDNYISNTGFWLNNVPLHNHKHSKELCNWISNYLSNFKNEQIIDFGCGRGDYLIFLKQDGFTKLLGVEGDPIQNDIVEIIQKDLTTDFYLDKKGIVISLEVGEHIPMQYESIYLNNLKKHCDSYLIISWAIKGQGGYGHVNELNNDEIISKIESIGFTYLQEDSNDARSVITDCWWFKNTLLVFKKI